MTKAHVKFQSDLLEFFQDKVKKRISYASLCPSMHATDTIFIDKEHITLPKLREIFQHGFLSKDGKVQKSHKLCLIILIDDP